MISKSFILFVLILTITFSCSKKKEQLVTLEEKNYLFKYHLDVYNNISSFLDPKEKKWLAGLIQ